MVCNDDYIKALAFEGLAGKYASHLLTEHLKLVKYNVACKGKSSQSVEKVKSRSKQLYPVAPYLE